MGKLLISTGRNMANRKGIMGIGTLIIFIATILVAAVAAGVIISTSGVLQQRALLAADQSEQRLINGVQITHVFMQGDLVNKTANNIEVLARPEPASGPINFKTTSLSFFTNTDAFSATLSHQEMIEREFTPDFDVDNTWQPFGDLDGDGVAEEIRLENGVIEVNMSSAGVVARADPGFDTGDPGQNVSIEDAYLEAPDGMIYGYVHIEDGSTSADQLDEGTVTITDEMRGECTFEKLRPETRYCVVTMVGVDDTVLEYGETVFIYFKLREENVLRENDEFEIKIFPQDGRSTFVLDRVPSVIYKTRIGVFP